MKKKGRLWIYIGCIICGILCLISLLMLASNKIATNWDIGGKWEIQYAGDSVPAGRIIDLIKHEDDFITGTANFPKSKNASILGWQHANNMRFTIHGYSEDGEFNISYKGTIQNGMIVGQLDMPLNHGTFIARRINGGEK